MSIKNGVRTTRKIILAENYEDPQKPLKNVATDFVVREFFNTDSSLYHFLNLVIENFSDGISNYRKEYEIKNSELFFVYKGGNILRIISKEFLLDFPQSTTREITNYYAPFFKRSDADFSIYISPKLENFERVFTDMGKLAYRLQNELREKFLINPTRYFDFIKYKVDYQRNILSNTLREFNELELGKFRSLVLGNITVQSNSGNDRVKYQPQEDLIITFADKKPEDYVGKRLGEESIVGDNKSYLYVTFNDALDFKAGDWRSKFSLARTKIGFNLIDDEGECHKIGGELIDVSIPHRLDSTTEHFFNTLSKNIINYTLYHRKRSLDFLSYSLSYLIKDLEKVLFKQFLFPWEGDKYTKRLNRLFYMYFVDIFIKVKDPVLRRDIIENIERDIVSPMEKDGVVSDTFKTKYKEYKLAVTKFIDLVNQLLIRIRKEKDPNNEEELTEMIVIIRENISFITGTMDNIKQYCNYDGRVDQKDIYNSTIKDLL